MAGGPNHELNRIATGFNQMADTIKKRELDLVLELARTEQAWETLDLTINSLQDGLIAVDSDARVVLVNEAASHVFDIAPDLAPTSSRWPLILGLFVPCSDELYDLKDLPLYKALQGQSGGPQKILVKNKVVPEGRLISVVYRPMIDSQGKVGGLMVFTDITEVDELRRETAKKDLELLASQRRLMGAQSLGRIGNWTIDDESQLMSWSDELYRLFGVAAGTFDGRKATFLQLIHPKDRVRYAALRDIAMQNKTKLEIEYRILKPDGQTLWMHQIGQQHFDEDGKTSFRSGVVQEITARKLSELALNRSTELLHRTGKMALVGGWEISFAPLTIHWTDEIFLIHELAQGTPLTARRAIRFFEPDAQQVLVRALRAAMTHGTPWDLELALTTAKGRRIWVRTQGQASYRDGVFFGLTGVLQDITTQHNSTTQLRLLESCVAHLNDMVLITEAEPFDEPGPRIVFVNDAFERRTGYTRAEVIGNPPPNFAGTQNAKVRA